MDILNSIRRMDDFSNYPLEYLVGSDRYLNLIQIMLKDPNQTNLKGYYVLLHAAAVSTKGNSRVVQLLIDRGANVNSTTLLGRTPLHFAVCSRNHDAVVALIKAGVSINSADWKKKTALHFAICAKWSEPPMPVAYFGYDMRIVKRLIRNPDIDLNPVDHKGETPLMWAVRLRQSTVVSALLKKGANPNIPNNDNRTPLHEALSVRKPLQDIVFELLANGTGIYGVDKLGQTPVDILLANVSDDETHVFAERCLKLIAFRYRIRESVERQLEEFPLLSERLKRCSEEVRLMRKHVIYDNVTVHDFACGCFQSQDPMEEIYKHVNGILSSGLYIEYYKLIFCGMVNRLWRSAITRGYPEFQSLIS